MIGVYDYTVVATYLSLVLGVSGIFCAMEGDVFTAVTHLMMAGFLDAFDGRIARTKKNRTEMEKSFGIQLDSLNDLVCFGVLPAVIGAALGVREYWAMAILIFFVLAALIRLAYFNVTAEMQEDKGAVRKYYLGMPVTMSSVFVPLFWLVPRALELSESMVYVFCLLVLGVLFISPVKVRKAGLGGILFMSGIGMLEIWLMLTVGVG